MIKKNIIDLIIKECNPMEQGENLKTSNLGYGFLYYSFARLMNAHNCVVIGSARGFSPVCLAYAVRDNGGGRVTLIDPALTQEAGTSVVHGPPTNQIWLSKEATTAHTSLFGLEEIIRVIPKTDYNAFKKGKQFTNKEPIDILVIDGLHTKQGVRFDLENFGKLVKPNGIIFIHDSYRIFPDLAEYIHTQVPKEEYDMMSLNIQVGLSILRKRPNCLQILTIKPKDKSTLRQWRKTEKLISSNIDGCNEYGVYHNDYIIGGFGLWPQDEHSILRGVVVKHDYRNHGVGDSIIDHALATQKKPIVLWTENERWVKHLYYNYDVKKGKKIKKKPFFGNPKNKYCWKIVIPQINRGIDHADKQYTRNGVLK